MNFHLIEAFLSLSVIATTVTSRSAEAKLQDNSIYNFGGLIIAFEFYI